MEGRRLFIALPLDPDTLGAVLNWKESYKGEGVRWVEEEALHITAVPPWSESDIQRAKSLLDKFRGAGKMEVVFDNISYGPGPRRPRLIWATGKSPDALTDLALNLQETFEMKMEHRPWKMHFTLGRFKEEAFNELPDINPGIHWKSKLDKIILFESHLYQSGAEYERIHEVEL